MVAVAGIVLAVIVVIRFVGLGSVVPELDPAVGTLN